MLVPSELLILNEEESCIGLKDLSALPSLSPILQPLGLLGVWVQLAEARSFSVFSGPCHRSAGERRCLNLGLQFPGSWLGNPVQPASLLHGPPLALPL